MSKNKKPSRPMSSTTVEYVIMYTSSDGKHSRFVYESRDEMRDALRTLKSVHSGTQYHTSKVTTVRTASEVR